MTTKIKFSDVKVGDSFVYDSETFIKSKGISDNGSHGCAWSVYDGIKRKEWAFTMNEMVSPANT